MLATIPKGAHGTLDQAVNDAAGVLRDLPCRRFQQVVKQAFAHTGTRTDSADEISLRLHLLGNST